MNPLTGSIQSPENEDQDNIIKQKTFLLMVPLFAIAGFLWGGMYYYFQARAAAFIPIGYGLIAIISLLIYRRRKNFKTFRTTQLILILLLPCLLHLSLGDFVSSSAVVLWGTLCPLGALAFHNTKAAGYWFALYTIMLITVFLLQGRVFHAVSQLPPGLINILFALNIAAVTFLTFIVLRYFVNQNQIVKLKLDQEQKLLKIEREKSEKLLLNILPAPVAMRLKEGEQIIADEYTESAIMFADIVGFTNVSRDISPALLVENLNKIFTHFDKLAEEYGLEKIKTIGDSYMVASGLSGHKNDHLSNIADLALAIVSTIKEFSLDGQTKCEIRIGIHMGPIIAGVIGSKKFSYDIWGDAVNTASRMEKFGEAGKIQISQEFYDQIKDDYECQYRGKTDIKGKGEMELYFLLNKK
ncbi:MAG TPA: adenylate/guanylate cyclase domain-containing protein [Chitinophagaceae bacterium]|nr:adenylate/guanylate cyclase domain-containing protein [Chitinophagaceae bacterium]